MQCKRVRNGMFFASMAPKRQASRMDVEKELKNSNSNSIRRVEERRVQRHFDRKRDTPRKMAEKKRAPGAHGHGRR